jgi:plasmid stability protein
MAQLIVRKLEDELVRKLRTRAARHGRSTEAEHREILRRALAEESPRRSLKEQLLAMPEVGSDADFRRDRRRTRPVRL